MIAPLVLVVVLFPLIVATAWRVCRSARVRAPHHASGPLAGRTYPLA